MNKSKKNYRASAVDKFLSRSDDDEPETTEVTETPETSNISRISKISKTSKKPGPKPMLVNCCPLCLRITHDDKAYLDEASYQNRTDVTNYLRGLIHADRIANSKKNRNKEKP